MRVERVVVDLSSPLDSTPEFMANFEEHIIAVYPIYYKDPSGRVRTGYAEVFVSSLCRGELCLGYALWTEEGEPVIAGEVLTANSEEEAVEKLGGSHGQAGNP